MEISYSIINVVTQILIFWHVGILAGMRPCGVIVLFAELYSSESKSQVYAHLHDFLRVNTTAAENLGKQY